MYQLRLESEECTFNFPFCSPQFADLSGNGLTDLLLTSHEGLYGFNQVHHVGAGPLQALVACLVVAVGATYLTAVAGGSSGRRKMRSTDRTD